MRGHAREPRRGHETIVKESRVLADGAKNAVQERSSGHTGGCTCEACRYGLPAGTAPARMFAKLRENLGADAHASGAHLDIAVASEAYMVAAAHTAAHTAGHRNKCAM